MRHENLHTGCSFLRVTMPSQSRQRETCFLSPQWQGRGGSEAALTTVTFQGPNSRAPRLSRLKGEGGNPWVDSKEKSYFTGLFGARMAGVSQGLESKHNSHEPLSNTPGPTEERRRPCAESCQQTSSSLWRHTSHWSPDLHVLKWKDPKSEIWGSGTWACH